MARIRTVKPEFPQSESMGRVSRDARLLFILTWTLCDDAGRTRAASRMLASLLYPYDDDAPKKIDGWLAELEREGCIVRYSADGATYLQVCNWLSHQKIDKPSASKIPPFDEASRIVANPREGSSGDLRIKDQGSKDQGRDLDLSVPQERDDGVDRVFDHWKTIHRHPKSQLDPKRRKLIRDRLKTYSESDLCLAITGYQNSPHHMGQNSKATVYDDLELFLRDAAHIDAGIKFASDPPRTDLSTTTRRNVAAIADWIPPEARNATS
jgi:hypothetical protein